MENHLVCSYNNVLNTLTSMISSGRLCHAFLLLGDKGLGKKTLARRMAKTILCTSESEAPCLKCRSCKTIDSCSNPDVISIRHADNKGFSVKNLRQICVDAYVTPNESEYKIYIFEDCSDMAAASQNTLLKLIEEPPSHAIFIFTANSRAALLPTILSRVVSLGVSEVSIEECRQALHDNGISDQLAIDDAIDCFGGNIGNCLDYINGQELKQAVEIARDITDRIFDGNEYSLLKSINSLEKEKSLTKTVLRLLTSIIRDCSAIKLESTALISCYKNGARKLSQRITHNQANRLIGFFAETSRRLDANANLSLSHTSMCAGIKSII